MSVAHRFRIRAIVLHAVGGVGSRGRTRFVRALRVVG